MFLDDQASMFKVVNVYHPKLRKMNYTFMFALHESSLFAKSSNNAQIQR